MRPVFILMIILGPYTLNAQDQLSGKDSTAFLDSVFEEMDIILDQMIPAKSFLTLSAGTGTGFFNFKSTSSTQFTTEKKLLFSTAINYFHTSGLGISTTGYAIHESNRLTAYQFSITPSYDYFKRGKFSSGIAYTRYFTKEELSFYTTPINNEAYVYFNYKKFWLQPGASVAFGWGSRTEYQKKQLEISRLRRRRNSPAVDITNTESVTDLSLLVSVRHDFMWSQLFNQRDLLTLTPVLLLSSGTQHFGFNTSYQSNSAILNNFLPGNHYLSDQSGFDVQSASAILRADYAIGKFFVQSQVLLDYYLHSVDKRLNNAFAIIAGVNF